MPDPISDLIHLPTIPSVGQPCKAYEAVLMATFVCLCKAGNRPLLLRGTDMAAVCEFCQKHYIIMRAEFDRQTMVEAKINIGVMILPPRQ